MPSRAGGAGEGSASHRGGFRLQNAPRYLSPRDPAAPCKTTTRPSTKPWPAMCATHSPKTSAGATGRRCWCPPAARERAVLAKEGAVLCGRRWFDACLHALDARPCFEHYPIDAACDAQSGAFSCDICIPVVPLSTGCSGAARSPRRAALTCLKSHATVATLEGMARYAIPSDHAYGVAMKDIKALGKALGRDHELALALWRHGRLRGAHAGLLRRRSRTAHARADGPLVQGLRQLGLLRRDVLQPVRPHAARLGQGRAVERQARANSRSAPPSRCCGACRVHDKHAGDEQFSAGSR